MKPAKRDGLGRYAIEDACDFCGKPITGEHVSDGEACGNSDGPGFYLCDRARCEAKRDAMTLSARVAAYVAGRERKAGRS